MSESQDRERIERLENQMHVLRQVLDKVLSRLEGLVRDLGLAADLAELRELRQQAPPPAGTPARGLTRKAALELGERIERLEAATRTAHQSVRGLRRPSTTEKP
ncbi:MAG: hypothetical protein ACRCSL_16870 [Microbacterium sp.]